MATKTKSQSDIRFIVNVSHPDKYLEVDLIVVVMEDGKIRNPSIWGQSSEYADLHITSHLSDSDSGFYYKSADPPVSYRNVYSVDRPRAEVMTKTLKRIERKVQALNNTFGYPQDFVTLLGYLSMAITNSNGSVFGRKVSGTGHTYDESVYEWMDVNSLRYYLDRQIREWKGEK